MPFLSSECFRLRFVSGGVFPAPSFFTAAKTIFQSYPSMTLIPENVKKTTQNLLQPIHAFSLSRHKTVCNCYGQSDTNTLYEPRKDQNYGTPTAKNADKLCIFAKEKPKSNTFVFDLGFEWRKEWDSLRDIISLHLFSLGSSYTSLIRIISLSLSRARKFICIVKMKTGYSRFPQAGVLRLDFRYRSNANDGNELPRYYVPTSFRQNKKTHMF